jgi:hypothetical protein
LRPVVPYTPNTIAGLTESLDEALELLRRGCYPELSGHFQRIAQQAQGLAALRQALEDGSRPPLGVREGCELLGRKLLVFSEVARQVAAVECGVLELFAGPRDSSYGRDGQCETSGGTRFEQEV